MKSWLQTAWLELFRRTEPPNAIIKAAIVYKGIGGIFLFVSAALLLGLVSDTNTSDRLREFLLATALDSDHVIVENTLFALGMITATKGVLLALAFLFYAVLEWAESIGLAMRRRWAEYLTFIATVLLLPPEIIELYSKFTAPKLILFVVNVALAIYLVVAKQLFQVSSEVRKDERRGMVPEAP